MKKVIWAVLVTAASATSAALTVRALDAVWRRMTHEPAPRMPRWARFVMGIPLKRQLSARIHAEPM